MAVAWRGVAWRSVASESLLNEVGTSAVLLECRTYPERPPPTTTTLDMIGG